MSPINCYGMTTIKIQKKKKTLVSFGGGGHVEGCLDVKM